MSISPDSPTDITQDLPRAVTYATWASKFSNANPPDGLSDFGAWGHVARWLAQKGASDLTLRSAITGQNLLAKALTVEPNHALGWPQGAWNVSLGPLGPNARGSQNTLRGMLLWGVNRSPDKIVETWGQGQALANAVAHAIESDPDPAVRLEAMKMVSQAAFPVQRWAHAVLPALDRAQAILAESAWDASTRRALQKWISDTRARLLTLLATAQGMPGGDYVAPPAPLPGQNWALIVGVGLGGIVVALVGASLWRRRQRRLAA